MSEQHHRVGHLLQPLSRPAEQVVENPAFKIENITCLVPKDGTSHGAKSLSKAMKRFGNGEGRCHTLVPDS